MKNNLVHLSLISIFLFCFFLFGCDEASDETPLADGDETDGDFDTNEVNEDEARHVDNGSLSRLHQMGRSIVNEAGQPVILKGVNLGGLFFHETWITQTTYSLTSRIYKLSEARGVTEGVEAALSEFQPVWRDESFLEEFLPKLEAQLGAEEAAAFMEALQAFLPALYDDSDKALRLKLSERFGDEGRDELLAAFQDAWITAKDIQKIAEMGFNVVRVPMSYRTLTTGADADEPNALQWNDAAFSRVDRLLEWCEAAGVYVVLDIQESPGGHNDYAGVPTLYTNPAMQTLTVELWKKIATRYKDSDVVAAFSLLAEPLSAPDAEARDDVYDLIIQGIRDLGDTHLLIVHDGFLGMKTLPDPEAMGWENIIYSTHIFDFEADSLAHWEFHVEHFYDPVFKEAYERYEVPYFIGSFSARKDKDWAYETVRLLVDWFNGYEWSWSIWTWKKLDDPTDEKIWGIRTSYGILGRIEGSFDKPDLYQDDKETLLDKFEAYRTLDIQVNESLWDALEGGL